MARKSLLAARGELAEPSVVQTPRATAIGRVPNSVFGLAYYPALAVLAWLGGPALRIAALAAAAAAALMSLYLAYSLLFVTRQPCKFCWTAHTVNWLLLLIVLFFWT